MFILTTRMRDRSDEVVFDTTHATLEEAKLFAEKIAACDWSGGEKAPPWMEIGYVASGPDYWELECLFGEQEIDVGSSTAIIYEKDAHFSIKKV